MASQTDRQIERNIAVHNKVARKYEALHGEIFNEIEQTRLKQALAAARDAIKTGSPEPEALDFGCGSGNLSRRLLDLGLRVTAADVSEGFLRLVRERFPGARLRTFQMNGRDLTGLADASFDLCAAYSVLHHIPNYLAAVAELARVCKVGGVIVLDHEATEAHWKGDPVYRQFQREALRFDWKKYLTPSNYVHRVRGIFNPRHSNEGDIHVWPDDHIEWSKIQALLEDRGFEVFLAQDYPLNRTLYRPEVYQTYVGRCTDTRIMVFRRTR